MGEPAPFKYRAFLSYCHADTRWARWLHKALEGFHIDKDLAGRETAMGAIPKSLRPVFRDRYDFTAGHSLTQQTLAALDASAALVVICSPASAESQYVNEEIRLFKERHPERPVIPVIVAGSPGGKEDECFPPAVRFKIGPQGQITETPEEVLGADVREAADGKSLAFAKVVARLLGLATDDVFRRAERERRRQGRIRMGVTTALAALFVVAGLFVYRDYEKRQTLDEVEAIVAKYSPIGSAEAAVPETRESLKQAITAIAEGRATDRRYAKALELLKAGKPQEAEPLLREVAEEKAARAEQNRKDSAAAFRNLGAIAGLGDPKRAREAYARALEFDAQDMESLYWHGWLSLLAGKLPVAEKSFNRLLTVATARADQRGIYRAHLRLGELIRDRGDLSAAREHQDQAFRIAERQVAVHPDDTEWQRDLSVVQSKIGVVLVAQGELAEALKRYEESFAIAKRLANADPADARWQRDLSFSHIRIGSVLMAQGNLPEALKSFRDSLAIRERLAESDPANAQWQSDLSASYDRVGEVLVAQHKLAEALDNYRASLALRERLAKTDPGNAGWQGDLAASHGWIGIVLYHQDNLPAALDAYNASLTIFERLAKADPADTGWQRSLAVSHNKVGEVLVAQDKLAEALDSYRASLAIRERLAKADPGNARWQRDVAACHSRLAKAYQRLSDPATARDHLSTGRAIIAKLVAQHPSWPRLKQDLTWFDDQIAALEAE